MIIEHTLDPAAAARLLAGWMADPHMTPESVGWPIDLWITLCGHSTDPDSPGYDEGVGEALSLLYLLAESDPVGPTTVGMADGEPAPTVVTAVVEGEVL